MSTDTRQNLADGKYKNEIPYERGLDNPWRKREYEIRNQVQADLEAEHRMEHYPKRGLVWHKAWEDGHSSGYGDVISEYEQLVELIDLTPYICTLNDCRVCSPGNALV